MKPPINATVTAETLLWGIEDRESGGRVAEALAGQVLESLSRQPIGPPLADLAHRLQTGLAAKGLTPVQLQSALLAAGALLPGPGEGRPADDLEAVVEQAARISQTYTGEFLGQFSEGVARRLTAAGHRLRPSDELALGLFMAGRLRQQSVALEMARWAAGPGNPQSGLACGSFLRPESLFSERNQTVVCAARSAVNPTGLEEVRVGGLNVVSMDQFLLSRREILIGFGKPNVFTLVPSGAAAGPAYQKLDAFMFFRKPARVANAAVAPSGVFLRLRNLPGNEAIEAIRGAMRAEAGKRSLKLCEIECEGARQGRIHLRW